MIPAVKKRWVKALRSGEYEQGMGSLRRTDGSFCCLGVLCDTEHEFDWTLSECEGDRWECEGRIGFPPYAVLENVGLSELKMYELSKMNDNGATFPEIADWIEENL